MGFLVSLLVMFQAPVGEVPPVAVTAPVYAKATAYSYGQGVAKIKSNKGWLVTFVGIQSIPVEGAVVCEVDELPGYTTGQVILSKWENGQHIRKALSNSVSRLQNLKEAMFPRLAPILPPVQFQPVFPNLRNVVFPNQPGTCVTGNCPNRR